MKVVSIVGARPQFIKAFPVSQCLRKTCHEVLVHTGQHYDALMSDVFFQELKLPEPDYNLGVGSGTHGRQTADALVGIETILATERPDVVLVYGDTNSTLAGGLAASKLGIPLAHVEAGLRGYRRKMPEEINRVLVDHISDILFTPTATASDNLRREGITEGVRLVGDVMLDALNLIGETLGIGKTPAQEYGLDAGTYYVATIHRAENTDDPVRLASILEALGRLDHRAIFPVHPRTQQAVHRLGLQMPASVILIPPLSYKQMLQLVRGSIKVLTDSGGLQKEAYFLKVPCVTLRDETEWVETLRGDWNIVAGVNPTSVLTAVAAQPDQGAWSCEPFGSGHAADLIVQYLSEVVK